jgi:hypothetical protein
MNDNIMLIDPITVTVNLSGTLLDTTTSSLHTTYPGVVIIILLLKEGG